MQQRLFPRTGDTDIGGGGEGKDGGGGGGGGGGQEGRPPVLTVSELTRSIRDILTTHPSLQDIQVAGEIFEVSRPSSGHMYLTLKDEGAILYCVLWRSTAQRLRFDMEEGQRIVARGSVSVYERQGKYQFYATSVQPEGLGALKMAFERLKMRLEGEGLFDTSRKRPIPTFPGTVGIVTSPTGAAIQDIIRVARSRWPPCRIVIAPASVQGETSAGEVVGAIELLNSIEEVDVILVSRGGGSLEDLWSFNEEPVARAIFSSGKPVVTGIGHEVDRTIADYVADRAAATPSQAAEIIFPDSRAVSRRLVDAVAFMSSRLKGLLRQRRETLRLLAGSWALSRPRALIDEYRQVMDDTTLSLVRAMQALLQGRRHHLQLVSTALGSLDPRAILERGYSITIDDRGRVVKDPMDVGIEERIKVIVHKGDIQARVEGRKRGEEDGEEDQGKH